MPGPRVWFITGAGRGMGVDIAKAALAAGNPVVATGRNPDRVTKAVGDGDDLLVVPLDSTITALRTRIDGFEAQRALAASTDFPLGE